MHSWPKASRKRDRPCVVQFGHYKNDYSRNVVLRKIFRFAGADVSEANEQGGWPNRSVRLIRRTWSCQVDVLLVSFPGFSDMIVAKLVATKHRALLIFDPFYGMVETSVEDTRHIPAVSARSIYLRVMDRLALRLADVVLVDTNAHAEYFVSRYGVREAAIIRMPVGALLQNQSDQPTRTASETVHVVQYSNYKPLPGTAVVVEAAALTRSGIRYTLIGGGHERRYCEELAARLGVTNITFVDSLPYEELRKCIASSDIALGIFGTSPKAARVVPNKVVDAMAEGLAIITADSPAIRELIRVGTEVVVVPAGDPSALAGAIDELAADITARNELGQAARARFDDSYSNAALTAIAQAILEGVK